jgi:hypothetical protein
MTAIWFDFVVAAAVAVLAVRTWWWKGGRP